MENNIKKTKNAIGCFGQMILAGIGVLCVFIGIGVFAYGSIISCTRNSLPPEGSIQIVTTEQLVEHEEAMKTTGIGLGMIVLGVVIAWGLTRLWKSAETAKHESSKDEKNIPIITEWPLLKEEEQTT